MFAHFSRCASEYCDGKLVIYEVERGGAGVTLGLHNRFPNALNITLDCSDSENVISHMGTMVTTVRAAAGAAIVAHHLAPAQAEERWSWTFSLNARMAAS